MTEDRKREAIRKWAQYCLRYAVHPVDLIGSRYPGHEDIIMDGVLASEVREQMKQEQGQ